MSTGLLFAIAYFSGAGVGYFVGRWQSTREDTD